MPKSAGKLRYSPQLIGSYQETSKFWLVVDCDPELGRYYRALYRAMWFGCRELEIPAWKEHITVVRNEPPPEDRQHLWERYNGKKVEFEYLYPPETDGYYVWLNVLCPELLDMREELGLPRDPEFPLHVSIGHMGVKDVP